MCVLIGSPHVTSTISQAIRSYLNQEWQRNLDEEISMSIPMVWAKEHPGMSHHFNAETIPHIVGDVPSQNNGYDCGLFLLTYMDLWTYSPPDAVHVCEEGRLQGKRLCCYYACTFCRSAMYICFVFQVLELLQGASRLHQLSQHACKWHTEYEPGHICIVRAALADSMSNLMHSVQHRMCA